MRTTFLRPVASDGLVLQGLLHEPSAGPRSHAVLHIHGMAGNCYENRFLDHLAAAYTDAGLALLSINTRGHDSIADFAVQGDPLRTRRVGSAYETFAESARDIRAGLDALRERGYAGVHLQGHSLGASKVTAYAAGTPDPCVRSLVLLAPTEMIRYAAGHAEHAARVREATELVQAGRSEALLTGFVWGSALVSAATYLDLTTRGNPVDVFGGDEERPAPLGRVSVPITAVMGTRDSGMEVIGSSAEAYLELLRRTATSSADFAGFAPDDDHGYTSHPSAVAEFVAERCGSLR